MSTNSSLAPWIPEGKQDELNPSEQKYCTAFENLRCAYVYLTLKVLHCCLHACAP